MNKVEEFLKWAEENGWNVERNNQSILNLPQKIKDRYKSIPKEYQEFLQQTKCCISPDETAYFLCLDDYSRESSDTEFSWDEFEKISLEAAEDDEEWKEEIADFWQTNMPIVFSVKSGYTYFALKLDNNYGEVVSGYEPEFEETKKISSSFFEFLEQIMNEKVNLDTGLMND